jgi:hypothetical protein
MTSFLLGGFSHSTWYKKARSRQYVGQFLMTFKEYPQRQKAASFNMDEVMEKLKESGGSK